LYHHQLDDVYTISEVESKEEFEGKTLKQLDENDKFHLKVITIIRVRIKTNLLGKQVEIKESMGTPDSATIVKKTDVLVVFGKSKDILSYCNEN
jgi:trk system potassium uptake protein TrkA